jgi:hypothetical protein
MSDSTHLLTWISRETKERFGAIARTQDISESALLKRLIEGFLGAASAPDMSIAAVEEVPASGRMSVRLRIDDILLLRERAKSRGMAAATYISFLVRTHLRNVPPMPDSDLKVLKQAIGEVSAVGRLLNQIARAINSGEPTAGASRADLQALLRACTGLRDAMKEVLSRNAESWEIGHEKTPH